MSELWAAFGPAPGVIEEHVELREGFIATLYLVPQEGGMVIHSLTIQPDEDVQPLRRGGLTRAIAWGTPFLPAKQHANRLVEAWARAGERLLSDEDYFRLRAGRPAGRGRGKEDPEGYYATIAKQYLEALKRSPRDPIRTMQKDHWKSLATIRSEVQRARDHGWLTKPGKGKAGGEATAKLKAWLGQQEKKGDQR